MSGNESDPVRVLLVDDYPAMAELMAEGLHAEDSQFVIDTVSSVDDALARLDQAGYDCIVSDYEMSSMTGIEFLDTVRDDYPDLPFILVTGEGSETVASEAISAGVTDYLRKETVGTERTMLASRIRSAVERQRAQQERQTMRERMELALEATDSMIFEIDFVANTYRQHGADEESLGIEAEDIRTPDAYANHIVHPDDSEGFREFLSGLRDGDRTTDTYEYRTHPDLGETRWIRASGRVREDADGAIRVLGSAQDITEQKRRIRDLELAETVFEQTQDAVFLIDVVGDGQFCIERVNPAYEEATGFDSDSLQGRSPPEVFGEAVGGDIEARYRECVEGREPIEYEESIPIQGETRYWQTHLAPVIRDETVVKLVGATRDVTTRKERERELQQEHDRFRAVFEDAFDAMVIADDDGQYIEINQSATELFGLPKAELIGKSIEDFAPADFDFAEAWRTFKKSDRNRGTFPLVRPDGSERLVEYAASANIVAGQHLSILRDVTEREQRETKILEERAFIDQALDTLYDTFYVVDPDGGLRRWNQQFRNVTGYDDERIAEMDAVEFFPEAERGRIADAIEKTLTAGEVRVEAEFLTADGERIPHEFTGSRLTDPDGTVTGLVGVGRDITERKEYERQLSALNETTTEFAQAKTRAEASEYILSAMVEVAELPSAAIFLYDQDDGVLKPAAQSESGRLLIGSPPTIGPGEGIAWRVFASGEPVRYDDVREAEEVYNPGTPIRSELIVSLGEHGVLVAGDPQPGVFDDRNQELAEIIAAAAEAALDSVTQTERLRERTQELNQQTHRLDRINQLNDSIRSINRTIVDADSQERIFETICGRIADLDVVEFAWIGAPNPDRETLSKSTWGGTSQSYLEMRELPIEDTVGTEPALEAAQTGDIAYVPDIVRADDTGQWGTAALQQGYKSVLSVPLTYEDSLYGVLSIYAGAQDVFDEAFRDVLVELGDLVGLGLNALDRRDALLGRRHTNVELGLGSEPTDDEPFLRMADRLNCTVEISRILPREKETLVYAACTDVTRSQVTETVEDFPGIMSVRRVRGTDPCRSEPCLFEFLAADPGLVSRLAGRGVRSHTMTFERGRGHIVATVPSTVNPTTLVADLRDHYPNITLEGTEIQREQASVSDAVLITEELTAAQREAIEAAHEAGFFEWPRDSTSEEVASALGISQPSFAQRLRAAQAKVFDAYCRGMRFRR